VVMIVVMIVIHRADAVLHDLSSVLHRR
jgi:hypothetical protein